MLIVMTAVAAICALLARAPHLAATLGALVAATSLRLFPEALFPDENWIFSGRSQRWLTPLLAVVGLLFAVWALVELTRPPGERGMAALAGGWATMMLALAGVMWWQRR